MPQVTPDQSLSEYYKNLLILRDEKINEVRGSEQDETIHPPLLRLSKINELGQVRIGFTNEMALSQENVERLKSNSTFEENLTDPAFRFALIENDEEQVNYEKLRGWHITAVSNTTITA